MLKPSALLTQPPTPQANLSPAAIVHAIRSISAERASEGIRERFVAEMAQLFPLSRVRFLTPARNGKLNQPLRCDIQGGDRAPHLRWHREPVRGVIAQGPLARCMSDLAHHRVDDGQAMDYLTITDHNRVTEIIELRHAFGSRTDAGLLHEIAGVYQNFLALLSAQERDSLTGISNRAAFDAKLSAVAQSLRGKPPGDRHAPHWWLMMIDADHFKQVNDTFGHLIGDEVLLLIAQAMQHCFRQVDGTYRYGGEEFAVILSPCTHQDALRLAERLRKHIAWTRFPQVGQVTVSIGLAPIDHFDHVATIVGRADKALYSAKRHGRNCVIDNLEQWRSAHATAAMPSSSVELFD